MDKNIRELFLKIGLTIIVLLFITVLLTKRFVYFRPSSKFLPVTETYKVIRQGHLHGWIAEGPSSSKVVLLCHGNKGNISHLAETIHSLNRLGFSVLAFDYSGFGKSGGIPSEQSLYDDASYMVALLRQTYEPWEIVLYGQDLGAPISTYAARRYGIPTLVLVSPIIDASSIIRNTPLKYFSRFFTEFNTEEYLRGYSGRSLLIHSVSDDYIPYESTASLRSLVTEHIPSSGTHENTIVPWTRVKKFIEG